MATRLPSAVLFGAWSRVALLLLSSPEVCGLLCMISSRRSGDCAEGNYVAPSEEESARTGIAVKSGSRS